MRSFALVSLLLIGGVIATLSDSESALEPESKDYVSEFSDAEVEAEADDDEDEGIAPGDLDEMSEKDRRRAFTAMNDWIEGADDEADDDNIDLPQLKFTLWGRWCGPGNKHTANTVKDEIDGCCREHDKCYVHTGTYYNCCCDATLIKCVKSRVKQACARYSAFSTEKYKCGAAAAALIGGFSALPYCECPIHTSFGGQAIKPDSTKKCYPGVGDDDDDNDMEFDEDNDLDHYGRSITRAFSSVTRHVSRTVSTVTSTVANRVSTAATEVAAAVVKELPNPAYSKCNCPQNVYENSVIEKWPWKETPIYGDLDWARRATAVKAVKPSSTPGSPPKQKTTKPSTSVSVSASVSVKPPPKSVDPASKHTGNTMWSRVTKRAADLRAKIKGKVEANARKAKKAKVKAKAAKAKKSISKHSKTQKRKRGRKNKSKKNKKTKRKPKKLKKRRSGRIKRWAPRKPKSRRKSRRSRRRRRRGKRPMRYRGRRRRRGTKKMRVIVKVHLHTK